MRVRTHLHGKKNGVKTSSSFISFEETEQNRVRTHLHGKK